MDLPHTFTEGEKKCLEEYWATCSKTPRKNLLKLIRHVNIFNPNPTKKSWEYIFWDRQLTDEMIDFALSMKLRKDYYITDLAKKNNMTVEHAAQLGDEMVHVGLLQYSSDDDGVDMLKLDVFAPGTMELAIMTEEQSQKFPEMAPAFCNYVLDLQKIGSFAFTMGDALFRVVPVTKAIENETKKCSFEEAEFFIRQAGESIAVAPCECRKMRRMMDQGTADLEGEWCINLGKYAESCIRVGKARRISQEEAIEKLRRAEELGYVHQISNIDGKDYSIFICNCSWDNCMGLKLSWYTNSPNMSRSNFVATVNKNNCVACGRCTEVCPVNAVKIGQKLLQQNPVEVKDKDTADDHIIYLPNKWEKDFMYNRKNVIPETGTSPCKTECPAHIAVQGYLKLAGEERYMEALELIKYENPFPAMCGRVCARYCEDVCTRGTLDAPVAIDEVKKWIADQELKETSRYIPKKMFDKGHKIAVIGSGPAGLSCAYYLAVYGHDVTVFEKDARPGGMMTYGMPNFRLEKDVVQAEIDIVKALGVEIKCGVEVGKDVTIQQLRDEGYKGFYLAIGAQGGRKLSIPGEDAKEVLSGVEFLKDVADEKLQKLKGNVVVIGGGNVAVDVARTAVRTGADSVAMYCLESRDILPAADDEVAEAEEESITLNCGWGPKEIVLKDGKVSKVIFKKCTSVFNSAGKFDPKYDENDTMEVKADYVLAAIGQSIVWGDLLKGENVTLNPNQTVKADDWTYATSAKDIFAGGDVVTGPKFAIDAIAAGKQGAESLHRAVWDGHDLILGRIPRNNFKEIDKDNLVITSYDHSMRQVPGKDAKKVKSFSDERLTLTEEQVKVEAARCLSCGAAHVDQKMCIGCGLCTTRCKFDAIHLHKEFDEYGDVYEKLIFNILKKDIKKWNGIMINRAKSALGK